MQTDPKGSFLMLYNTSQDNCSMAGISGGVSGRYALKKAAMPGPIRGCFPISIINSGCLIRAFVSKRLCV